MSRARKVEPQAALQAALALFWRHGYGALGTRRIEEETGLTRFTLQTSYGGKKSLFLKTLDIYLDRLETGFLPRVTAGDMENVATWFEARADPARMADISCHGCLMLNAAIEFGGRDADINLRTERYFAALRQVFTASCANAQKTGALPPDFDIAAKVEILLGIVLGLNVVIRAAADNTAGRAMAHATAAMIRRWQQRPD